MKNRFLSCLVLLLVGVTGVQAQDFLDPAVAFKLQAQRNDAQLQLNWTIAPGYHLYSERIEVKAVGAGLELGALNKPVGKQEFDKNFGKNMELYTGTIAVSAPIIRVPQGANELQIEVTSQGCADAGLCYPPQQVIVRIPGGDAGAATGNEDERIASALSSGSLWRIALMFFGLGLLLSFTPCVLPMIPILSSIIVGSSAGEDAKATRARGLLMSLAYSAGMILVYTTMGLAAGLLGEGLSAALQKPWVIAIFASLLFGFGLAMFDVFTLQVPAGMQNRLTEITNRIPGGRFTGVFAMGGLSALIVGPCVAGPLAGALVYISKTGNVLVGGVALFCLSLGMSQPLLLTGLSAGKLLPRAGAWMDGVKRFFGLLLFATALWLAHSILPQAVFMIAYAMLLLMSAIWLSAFSSLPTGAGLARTAGKALGLVCAALAAMQLVGVASGGTDALQPIKHLAQARNGAVPASAALQFKPIKSDAELQTVLAKAPGPVVLDFYADWCTSCKEMEHGTFTDPRVINMMSKATLLRADVTKNSAQDKELMKRFSLFGPPALVVLQPDGKEVSRARVVGYKPAEPFLAQLSPILK